jgi:hypothetical protein
MITYSQKTVIPIVTPPSQIKMNDLSPDPAHGRVLFSAETLGMPAEFCACYKL